MSIIVKNTTFPSLLDLLAPHSCRGCGCLGEPLCSRCKNYIQTQHRHICPNCKNPVPAPKDNPHTPVRCPNCPNLPPIYALGAKNTLLGTLISDYKYHSIRPLGRTFAELLDTILPDFNTPVIIVPLPTATHHIRARGIDHTRLIARHLAHIRHYSTLELLIRAKNTVQVGSDKQTRLTQASHAYSINPTIKINREATYLLLDDIWTTGASIRAAINLLEHQTNISLNHTAVALLAITEPH